jgi:serine/threonine protein kinase
MFFDSPTTVASAAEQKLPALIFGKYEIIRRLALGGMGEVFLARQKGVAVDRLVILKSLLPELAERDGFVQQFLDEARVAATLNHPNIVAIFEVGLWEGVYFIAMEFIHGCDLARMQRTALRKQLSPPYQVSARIIMDAAHGLDHAHNAKSVDGKALAIVHRDISPHNIMVRGDGVTKVVDFGIAKSANRESRTATGTLKGKLQYMSPEQLMGNPMDGRADQFSLGIVLWELSTNRRLFKSENDVDTIEKILKRPIPLPSQFIEGFPPDLEAVVMRMLAKNPDDRYPRCADVARDLRHYLDGCSRTVGNEDVSVFVRSVLGEQLDEVTANLVPTKDNFLISLHSADDKSSATSTVFTNSMERVRRKKVGLASGLSAAFFLCACAATSLWWMSKSDKSIEPTAIATPPVVEPLTFDVKRPYRNESGALVGEVEITSPVGGRVTIDDEPLPNPVPTTAKGLLPGDHVVVVIHHGQTLRERVVIVGEASKQRLVVKSVPSKAMVWLGAKPMGTTPLVVDDLDAGAHYPIRVEAAGYETRDIDVLLKDGESREEIVRLKKTQPEPRVQRPAAVDDKPKAPGYFSVVTTPWANIFIDGEAKGATPLYKLQLPAGRHTVLLVKESEGIRESKAIVVPPGETVSHKWDLTAAQ